MLYFDIYLFRNSYHKSDRWCCV